MIAYTLKSEALGKSSQESEIDYLLAEEFACDDGFIKRFLGLCGLHRSALVENVVVQPSLGGLGFGDLLVTYRVDNHTGLPSALLIENKITASAAVRQSERYNLYAKQKIGVAWSDCLTILVAPSTYQGERAAYGAFVGFDDLKSIIQNESERRLVFRKKVIERAIFKKSSTGVRVPDFVMRCLYQEYISFFDIWNEGKENFGITALKEAYYDGDSWFVIKVKNLPFLHIRHRFWTDAKSHSGSVDLIVDPCDEETGSKMHARPFEGGLIRPYGKNARGLMVCVKVPEMRQNPGFDAKVAEKALSISDELLCWFRNLP